MKISVVVPVYNTAPFLKRCLDSVLNQRYADFEIVAVDDGSTDESGAVLDEYQNKDPEKIRVFHRENSGPSGARNFGVEMASGEAIAFVDSDDRVSPDFLSSLAAPMEKGAEIVQCRLAYEYENGSIVPVSDRRRLTEDPVRRFLISDPSPCCRLYQKKILAAQKFKTGIFYEDLECCPALVLQTERIAFEDKVLYFYRRRSGSTMKTPVFRPYMNDIFAVLPSLQARFRRAGRYEEFRAELEFLFIEHLLHAAALNFAPFAEAAGAYARIREMIDQNYPGWKKNGYYQKCGARFRLVARLAYGGHYRVLRRLAALRG